LALEELMRKLEFIAVFAALAVAVPAMAQRRGRGNGGVPPGQRPPAGMCRIWIDGLPPGQQPAPTDCGTAAARVPYNGRIIYGDQVNGSRRRVYDSNGQIYTNGQNCVQRSDRTGRIQTICSNNDNDRDDRVSSRVYGQTPVYRDQSQIYENQNRVYQNQNQVYGNRDQIVNQNGKVKHRKHKGDRDGDQDGDHSRD
jgi:hypothetical protein